MAEMEESAQDLTQSTANSSTLESPRNSKRMIALRDVMNKITDSYISKLKLLKPMKGVSSAHLEPLHKDILSQLKNNIKCELEQIYKEENVEHLLYGLDQMVAAENQENVHEEAWRPSGNPKKDAMSGVAVLKHEKLKVLQKTLGNLEAQNKLLQEKVKKKETHLLKTGDKVVCITEDMEQTVDSEKATVKRALNV